jgi:hypothetical protein
MDALQRAGKDRGASGWDSGSADDFIFRRRLISTRAVTFMPRASWNAN